MESGLVVRQCFGNPKDGLRSPKDGALYYFKFYFKGGRAGLDISMKLIKL